jgi:hypothetical protein
MNEVLINALVARIKAGQMTIDQVPIPYQESVQQKLEGEDSESEQP